MQAILNNPYRIVGLLVGATAREQERQVRRLKQFLEAEQDPPDDYSFPTIGNLQRTLEKVNEAAAKLTLDSDKMNAALFWFYDGNSALKTDVEAFNAIKETDLDQVLSIWTTLTSNGEVSQRNASAYNNLGTLYLSWILEGKNTNEVQLEKGISFKLKFLESAFYTELQYLATDEKVYKPTKKDIQLLFLKTMQSEIEKNGGITSNKFLEILTKQEFSAKEDFLKGFIQKPIEQIEKKIDEAKNKRKANKAFAASAGKSLYEQTTESLLQLKSILGLSNIKFASISDKVSGELLQCGIDYFKFCRDYTESSSDIPQEYSKYIGGVGEDFASASMDLFRKAKRFAVGNMTKQRCQENTENLQEWIDAKPERDKQKKVEEDLKFITAKLERFQNLSDTVSNAGELVDSCKPRLANIKSILGSTDEFYLKISSAVASNALGMLITAVNEAQESVEVEIGNFSSLRSVVYSALSVSESIGSFDLVSSQRTHFTQNHTALNSIASQLGLNRSSSSSLSSGSTNATNRTTPNPTTPSRDKNYFANIFPWIVAVIVVIICLVKGFGWASLFIGLFALNIVAKLTDLLK
jgi:hypothetical protein